MSVNFRKILFLSSLIIIFTLKQKCTEEEGFTIAKFNKIINGNYDGEYETGAIKPLLFIIDNFEISHLFWARKAKWGLLNFGLSFAYCPFPDVIKLYKNWTISFFNSHINFIRFILHTIRFFFHFFCDCYIANDRLSWDKALYKSAIHSLVLNTMCNIHLFTISCYNVKINLFSIINILAFYVYVKEENVDRMMPFIVANNNTHDSGNNNNTNNNDDNNTGVNSSFFINFNHHCDCYSYTTSTFNFYLEPFKGSSRLYLLLYPRIEIFL